MELSCGDDTMNQATQECGVQLTEETQGREEGVGADSGMEVHCDDGVEVEIEFWPLEHPSEPRDEDQPVKCPVLGASAISGGQMNGEQIAECMQKRTQVPDLVRKEKAMQTSETSKRAVRKRHHTLTHGDIIMTPLRRTMSMPPTPPRNITVFQMLQQFDKLEDRRSIS